MLKVALTKGRVEEQVIPLLERCGIDCEPIRNKKRKLILQLGDVLEVILVKGDDVLTYLNNGVVDLGIVGSDVLHEQQHPGHELMDLETGRCRFILASTADYDPNMARRPIIGTKYPVITQEYFRSRGMDVEIIEIKGSVELAPLVGLADAIVDITETGTTLRENNLQIYDELEWISTRLVVNSLSLKQKKQEILSLMNRLQKAVDEVKAEKKAASEAAKAAAQAATSGRIDTPAKAVK